MTDYLEDFDLDNLGDNLKARFEGLSEEHKELVANIIEDRAELAVKHALGEDVASEIAIVDSSISSLTHAAGKVAQDVVNEWLQRVASRLVAVAVAAI